jgi:hypothetical protein
MTASSQHIFTCTHTHRGREHAPAAQRSKHRTARSSSTRPADVLESKQKPVSKRGAMCLSRNPLRIARRTRQLKIIVRGFGFGACSDAAREPDASEGPSASSQAATCTEGVVGSAKSKGFTVAKSKGSTVVFQCRCTMSHVTRHTSQNTPQLTSANKDRADCKLPCPPQSAHSSDGCSAAATCFAARNSARAARASGGRCSPAQHASRTARALRVLGIDLIVC